METEMGKKVDNMDVNDLVKSTGLRRKATLNVTFCVKKERNASFKKVSRILQKSENDRTEEEKEVLSSCSEVVKEVTSRLEKRNKLKSRSAEVEDSKEVLENKCEVLARALQQARHLVVYSGAGVSTAACIPDYRGSNGIWTRLQQGLDIGQHDLSKTQPTLTHMVLYSLYRRGMLKHVVSQNCDGLHLRSGLPRAALSEVHGNMYLEVCQPCKLEYWRLFDVTEHTARYSHATARRCYSCHKPLRDTIVHFGERGALKWPINWSGATAAANQADVILCMGSSLKVLKKYPWLWGMDRPVKKRPVLYIVNLQWTPKDEQAALKINGKCDEVMSLVMSKLALPIPEYDPLLDPIFVHATQLHAVETHTYSTAALQPPEHPIDSKRSNEELNGESCKKMCNNPSRIELVKVKKEANDKSNTKVETVNTTENSFSGVEKKGLNIENSSFLLDENDTVGIHQKSDHSSTITSNIMTNDKDKEKTTIEQKSISSSSSSNINIKVKEEADPVENLSTSTLKHESKLADTCKSTGKGIWRPFSFDDSQSTSSSRVGKHVAIKLELGSSQTCTITNHTKLSVPQKHSEKLEIVSAKPDISGTVLCHSKSLFQDQNIVKKCLIQLEPLDLSFTKKGDINTNSPYFCKYCRIHYHSGFCLFYRKQSFENPPDPPCYCCEEDDGKDLMSPETDIKSPDDSGKSSAKVPITNPGWFGKGYRKKIRKKR